MSTYQKSSNFEFTSVVFKVHFLSTELSHIKHYHCALSFRKTFHAFTRFLLVAFLIYPQCFSNHFSICLTEAEIYQQPVSKYVR